MKVASGLGNLTTLSLASPFGEGEYFFPFLALKKEEHLLFDFHTSMTGVCFVSVEVKLGVFFCTDSHVWPECVEI